MSDSKTMRKIFPSIFQNSDHSVPKSVNPEERTTKPSGSTPDPLIAMENVVKIYKTPAGDFPALKGITARFYPGQFVTVIGKSGSGKSTLLNMITGIDRPTSGKILIDGTYLQDLSESQFSEWRGRNLGIVFQFFQLLPMLSLLENTILPMDFCNMYPPEEREKHAEALLRLVGLKDFINQPPGAVSSGQEQCAAIARALANDPPIIVADEPTGNLDSRTAEMVLQILDNLVAKGKTILVVTHDEAVAQRASRTLVISDGELVDETVSRALPTISHRSMLIISHQLIKLTKQPGEILCADTDVIPGLLFIDKGNLSVFSQNGSQPQTFGSGSVLTFNNISNFVAGKRKIQAGTDTPLKIKVIPVEDFQPILESSKRLQAVIGKLDSEQSPSDPIKSHKRKPEKN